MSIGVLLPTIAILFALTFVANQRNTDGSTQDTNRAASTSLQLLLAVIVASSNEAIHVMVRCMSYREKIVSKPVAEETVFWKVASWQICNTSILLLVISLPTHVAAKVGLRTLWPSSTYTDMSGTWYSVVAPTAFIILLINLMSPWVRPLFRLAATYKALHWNRTGYRPILSQRDMDRLYIGDVMDLPARYANLANVCFLAIALSGPMPLLTIVPVVGLTASYWLEKWSLLRVFRLPTDTGGKLPASFNRLMLMAVFCRLILSVWTFSAGHLASRILWDPASLLKLFTRESREAAPGLYSTLSRLS